MSDNATFEMEDLESVYKMFENNNHIRPCHLADIDEFEKMTDEDFMDTLNRYNIVYSVEAGLYMVNRWTRIEQAKQQKENYHVKF